MSQDPFILSYATPRRDNYFARMPVAVLVAVALLVPGLSSSLIRGSIWCCLGFLLALIMAFLFFGPIWGEYLFPERTVSELGLYPFLLTCVWIETVSVRKALRDRQLALS